ncbi:hypothetical protein GCM10027416_22910 [Okibacterium endophyticum]
MFAGQPAVGDKSVDGVPEGDATDAIFIAQHRFSGESLPRPHLVDPPSKVLAHSNVFARAGGVHRFASLGVRDVLIHYDDIITVPTMWSTDSIRGELS